VEVVVSSETNALAYNTWAKKVLKSRPLVGMTHHSGEPQKISETAEQKTDSLPSPKIFDEIKVFLYF
jgi:hypothetical protein